MIRVRELVAWGLDHYEYRPCVAATPERAEAREFPKENRPLLQSNVVLTQYTVALQKALAAQANRADLISEMSGLVWSLGVVDLRHLIAFQRRLFFSSSRPAAPAPAARDWPALVAFSFRQAGDVSCGIIHNVVARTLTLKSSNPNLHFRTTTDASSPVLIHPGSPFFEVACYRDRWFLRDGYHRAYTLLRSGVFEVPAVILEARSIDELGAVQPWFFSEDVLFANRPPLVSDFLDEDLILEYDRPPLIKTLRITMEESLAPVTSSGDAL